MRCTQYTVLHLQSHAVLKHMRDAVQSPTRTRVGPIWICADRACARMRDRFHNREPSTPPDRAPPVDRGRRTGTHGPSSTPPVEYIHAFPRPVSISHVQPFTDSAAGRPDPDTRQRAVGYDTADRRIACLPCCLHSSGVVEHPHAPGRGQMLQVLHATIVPGQTRETGGAS
jgi:hypothetical protein